MKVTFLKDFGEHKKGDTIEVEKERGAYWELVGVAKKAVKEHKEEVKKAPAKGKKK